jgi:hypothetical protein
MQERSHNFDEGSDESEVTLAAPRFDADDARRAHPVVPLDEVPAISDARAGRFQFRGGERRRWPLSLIVVLLLAVAALGGIATTVLRRAHTTAETPAPVSADAAQDRQTQTGTSPPEQADASALPQSAPAPTAAGEEKTEGRAPRRAREEHAARTERGEEILPPREAARVERRETDGEDVEHRGHFKGRDGQEESKDEKDSRKASKHPKKGGARLVDVIVGPSRP